MERIIDTFGQENYGRERMKLIHEEMKPLTDRELVRAVTELIATVPTKYPPLIPRFREAKLEAFKRRFNKDVEQVTEKLDKRSGLAEALEKLGAKSLADAIKKV